MPAILPVMRLTLHFAKLLIILIDDVVMKWFYDPFDQVLESYGRTLTLAI